MNSIRRAISAQGDDETMNGKATRIFLGGVLAALILSAVVAGSAGAAPAWKFNEKSLEGSEKIVGGAEDSSMTVSGLLTDCENFLYGITISNSGGTGQGSVTELPLFECATDSEACTVDAIEAKAFPWTASLSTISKVNYIVIKGVLVEVLYGGEECILNEWLVPVKGSAGGSINNTTESATFDSSSFTATGTKLEAFGQAVQWNGFFPTEAFEWHRNEALTVG
jgi:hypothetical protein